MTRSIEHVNNNCKPPTNKIQPYTNQLFVLQCIWRFYNLIKSFKNSKETQILFKTKYMRMQRACITSEWSGWITYLRADLLSIWITWVQVVLKILCIFLLNLSFLKNVFQYFVLKKLVIQVFCPKKSLLYKYFLFFIRIYFL